MLQGCLKDNLGMLQSWDASNMRCFGYEMLQRCFGYATGTLQGCWTIWQRWKPTADFQPPLGPFPWENYPREISEGVDHVTWP